VAKWKEPQISSSRINDRENILKTPLIPAIPSFWKWANQICMENCHGAKLPHRLEISLAWQLVASLVQVASNTVSHKHSSEGLPSWKVCTVSNRHTGLCPSKVSKVSEKTFIIRSSQPNWQHDLQILSGAVRVVVARTSESHCEKRIRASSG